MSPTLKVTDGLSWKTNIVIHWWQRLIAFSSQSFPYSSSIPRDLSVLHVSLRMCFAGNVRCQWEKIRIDEIDLHEKSLRKETHDWGKEGTEIVMICIWKACNEFLNTGIRIIFQIRCICKHTHKRKFSKVVMKMRPSVKKTVWSRQKNSIRSWLM